MLRRFTDRCQRDAAVKIAAWVTAHSRKMIEMKVGPAAVPSVSKQKERMTAVMRSRLCGATR